jgi:DNA recombination protein RmuC
MEFLIAALALLLGAGVGWIVATQRAAQRRDALRDALAQADADLARLRAQVEERQASFSKSIEERERAFAEQKKLLQDSQKQIEDAFARLAQDALRKNTQSLLEQTQERLAPLNQALGKLDARTQEIEKNRAQAYGSLEKHLTDLRAATSTLNKSNEVLVTAFKGSMTARGRFGEIQLRNLVDAAGMLQHCDFIEQEAIEGGLRPDMIIKLPEGDGIPVDAKLPLSAYWESADMTDPAERKVKLREHADLLRRQVRTLAKRDYSQYLKGRVTYTVLFLPADPILAAAYEAEPDLIEESARLRILIVTPASFLALLSTSRIIWGQRLLAENAQEIQREAGDLYRRVVAYQGHVAKIGDALERATRAYNDAGGSYRTRVLPTGRRIESLSGAADVRERLPEMKEIELRPQPVVRDVKIVELVGDLDHASGAEAADESVAPLLQPDLP